MVHNGIEYGIMQAYAEGFDIFKNATSKELPEDIRYDLNLPDIAEVWRRGSVMSSWLLDLTAMALTENPTLSEYEGYRAGFRRGALDNSSRDGRSRSRRCFDRSAVCPLPFAATHTFAEKMLSAMRQKFGGHIELSAGQTKKTA